MDKQKPLQAAFYSDLTLVDGNSIAVPGAGYAYGEVKGERRFTRRAFLTLGGLAMSAGGLGTGYAASRLRAMWNRAAAKPIVAMDRHAALRPAPTKAAVAMKAELVLSFTQHQQPVRSVTWSPGGKTLASGGDDSNLLVWDASGAVLTRQMQQSSVSATAWSPDGQQLVIGASNHVTFLNPLTGTSFAHFNLPTTAEVTSLAWSPQQPLQVVAGASDTRAIVWDATAYRTQTIFTRHTAAIEAASWAADGQTIATSSLGGVVRVWNGTSGRELHGFFLDNQVPKRALAFAPAGDQLAVGGDDGVIRLWNASICQQQAQGMFGTQCQDTPQHLNGHTRAVRTLGWSPDGRLLASGGDDGRLAIWSPARSVTPILTISHKEPVVAAAWSPDGTHIATAWENTVSIWQFNF